MKSLPKIEPLIFVGMKSDRFSIKQKFHAKNLVPPELIDFESLFEKFKSEEFDRYSKESSFKITDYKSIDEYKKKWIKEKFLNENQNLQRDFSQKLVLGPDIADIYPISCDYFF